MTTKRKLPNKSSDDNQEMEVEGGRYNSLVNLYYIVICKKNN